MGRTVLFDTIDALIVISERRMEPYDIGIFECVGLDPARYDYLLLKSRMYARPVFGALAKALVECDADQGGPTSSNYALFPFKNIRRPVYPLDENV
jgi:microcystin degradation protein MlrC